jgi:2-keto-3-deoxy-6-phosphogluconate aldolase
MCVGLGGELVNEGLILDGQRETIIQLGKQVLQQTAAF